VIQYVWSHRSATGAPAEARCGILHDSGPQSTTCRRRAETVNEFDRRGPAPLCRRLAGFEAGARRCCGVSAGDIIDRTYAMSWHLSKSRAPCVIWGSDTVNDRRELPWRTRRNDSSAVAGTARRLPLDERSNAWAWAPQDGPPLTVAEVLHNVEDQSRPRRCLGWTWVAVAENAAGREPGISVQLKPGGRRIPLRNILGRLEDLATIVRLSTYSDEKRAADPAARRNLSGDDCYSRRRRHSRRHSRGDLPWKKRARAERL
jgi:hypothetical protein